MKNLKSICNVCLVMLVISFMTSCQTEEFSEIEETSQEYIIEEKTNSTTTKAATKEAVRTRFRSSTSIDHETIYGVTPGVVRALGVREVNGLYWINEEILVDYKDYCKIKWQHYRADGQARCNVFWQNNSAEKAACRLRYTETAEQEIRTTCRR